MFSQIFLGVRKTNFSRKLPVRREMNPSLSTGHAHAHQLKSLSTLRLRNTKRFINLRMFTHNIDAKQNIGNLHAVAMSTASPQTKFFVFRRCSAELLCAKPFLPKMHANFNVISDPEFPCQVKLYSSKIEFSVEMCSRTFFWE